MKITSIYSFLVHPSKNEETQPKIGGTKILLSGKLYDTLLDIYNNAIKECDIDISFNPENGKKFNSVRDELIKLIQSTNLMNARLLAKRLQVVTTGRSGLGLLFIILGKDGKNRRVYISRFPADIGITAEEQKGDLNVELLERVFMKNTTTYKAVLYDGTSLSSDFWDGKAVDKQVTNKSISISNYWIREFLQSDFKTTSATGTRRLAKAIIVTIDATDDLELKKELNAAAILTKRLDGKVISMDNFADRFALSENAKEAMASTLLNPNLQFTKFKFSNEEFKKHVKYRTLAIDNGALLTAPFEKFDQVFIREPVKKDSEVQVISTKGKVVNEKLRKAAYGRSKN